MQGLLDILRRFYQKKHSRFILCNKQQKKEEEDEEEASEGSEVAVYDDDTCPKGLLRVSRGCYSRLERLSSKSPLHTPTGPPEDVVYYDDTRLEAQEQWRRHRRLSSRQESGAP